LSNLASNESSQITYNWRYNTCNGYRDLCPSQIDFSNDLIVISFGHIVTLWNYNAYDGVTFLNDLIHCNASDLIKEIKFMQNNFLLCVHNKCLNVWKLKNEEKTSTDLQLIKSGHEVDSFSDIKCVWSVPCDEVLEIAENPLKKSQFILFIKTAGAKHMKSSNEQIPTEIQSKLFFENLLSPGEKLSFSLAFKILIFQIISLYKSCNISNKRNKK